jgi:hypothetical protein
METVQFFIIGAVILIVIAIERAERKIVAEMRRIEKDTPIEENE